MDPGPMQTLGGIFPRAGQTPKPSPQPEARSRTTPAQGMLGVGRGVRLGVAHLAFLLTASLGDL